jgi:hypothetical protein
MILHFLWRSDGARNYPEIVKKRERSTTIQVKKNGKKRKRGILSWRKMQIILKTLI